MALTVIKIGGSASKNRNTRSSPLENVRRPGNHSADDRPRKSNSSSGKSALGDGGRSISAVFVTTERFRKESCHAGGKGCCRRPSTFHKT